MLPSRIQSAKVVKKAFVAERSSVKIILPNPFVKAKSLCIFATGILGTNLQVSQSRKVSKNARTEENISTIKAQETK